MKKQIGAPRQLNYDNMDIVPARNTKCSCGAKKNKENTSLRRRIYGSGIGNRYKLYFHSECKQCSVKRKKK